MTVNNGKKEIIKRFLKEHCHPKMTYPIKKTSKRKIKPRGFFVPSFYGINIRIDNRVGFNRLIKDKKLLGFMKCNKEMYNRIKNHPEMKNYNFK
jgi:hypothetical protein